ncbi:MAG TPA: MopE-related protein [Polyangiaceae bacterium]|nr:MopE-related protein [Polyangiaceae bacterium]
MNRARRARVEFLASAVLLPVLIACACSPGSGERAAAGGPRVSRFVSTPGQSMPRVCIPSAPERCFDARDDNCNGIIDEGCGVHTGLVQFVIAWDKPSADVDLQVTDPNGELVEVARRTQSGLLKERDCPGPSGDCGGQNLENVYLEEGDPLRGAYRVRVRLEKLGMDDPPVRVTLGARVGPRTYAFEFQLGRVEEERELIVEL